MSQSKIVLLRIWLGQFYLAKSYYLLSLTYGCEVWNIGQSVLHKVNVAREMHASDAYSVDFIERALNHYNIFAVFYQFLILHVYQRKLLFWKSLFLSENAILASLCRLTAHNFVAVGNCMVSRKLSVSAIKHSIWNTFTKTTSNYRLMFVICFVVDVTFMGF